MRKILLLILFASLAAGGRMSAQCTNRCLDFNPAVASDYVQTTSSPVTGNANFTVEARFLCQSTGANTRRLFAFGGGSNRFEVAESGGALRFIRQSIAGSITTSNITSANVRDGVWHHLAATRTGATVRVYLDGTQVYTTAGFTGSLGINTFRIGGSVLSTGATFHWDGSIDEVRVWDVERTAAQINNYRLCWAPCSSAGLKAYYRFDQGMAGGNNAGLTTLADCNNLINGTLTNFALNGSSSNWVCSDDAAFTSGPCCTSAITATQQGCGQVNFSSSTTGNFTYAWTFGDGGTSTLPSPMHTYTIAGTYTVTLIATPVSSGAPCEGQTTITVVTDNVPPTVSCKNLIFNYLTSPLTIVPGDVHQSSSDACCTSIGLSLIGQTTFDCADVCKIRTVTLMATDCNNNTATCVASVTVNDALAPVALCKDINVGMGQPGTLTISPNDVDAGTTDNCPGFALTVSPNTFGCPAQGCEQVHQVTLKATDCQGNTSICVAKVTVRDVLPPVMSNCPPSVFTQAAPGLCSAIFQNGATASDNCDQSLTISFSMSGATTATGVGNGSGVPCNVGLTTVTCTATDDCGQTGTCVFNVRVIDNQPPVLNCPPNMTVVGSITDGGTVVDWSIPVPTDNCPGVSLVQVAGLPSGSFFPCGTTTIVYQARDESGNAKTCNFTVTVDCPPCACGTFTNMTFSQNGSTPLSFKCGAFLPVSCPVIGSQLTLTGNFNCVNDTTCTPSNFQLVNSDGTPIGTGSISGGSFTWTFDGYFISNPGWYELYLVANCGQEQCRCIVRFTVPDCPPPFPSCDSISATATPIIPIIQGKDCCHSIQISNQIANFAASVNLQAVSGGSLLYTNVFPAAGWSIGSFSGGTSVGLNHSGGLIPVGNFTLGRICMSSFTATPQVLAVQYLNAAGQVICSDTLTLECEYCISIERDSIICDEATGGYTMTFCVHVANTNPFIVNSVVLMGPTGVNFSPAAFSLPSMPPGSTFCTLTTNITVPAGTHPDSICIGFTAHHQDVTKGFPPGECCMIKDCFDLPDCCPNFATATPVDTSDGKCCWKISLNQPAGTAQFVTLNVVPVPASPVTISGIGYDPNWNFNLALGQQSATFALTPTAALPAIVNLPTVCFDVPPGSPVPQLLEVVWATKEDILCRDTLEFFCRPDTNCVALTPLSLACVGGQNVYTVVVTPPFNSTLTVVPTHMAVVDVMPAGAVAPPGIFPLNSSGSTVISIPLIGTVGQVVCFKLNLYRNAVPGIFEDCCVTEDSFCVTLKDCNLIPRPQGIAIFPNPTRGNFTLDFGDAGSPSLGVVRVRDVAGRLLREEEVPTGSLKHDLQMPDLSSGLYFVEFVENRTRVWAEKLSVIR